MTDGSECVDLALSFCYESHGHTLHASCAEVVAHADHAPEYGAQFKSNDAIEHASCLLRHYQIHVERTRHRDRFFYRRLADFVTDDPFWLLRVETQHLTEVPPDCFSFAVLI